ncbi:bone morphogenetic protein 1-like [Exaiptasia diaphana]|uniref:Uncharacterized protein n=1 Tax=Exaiptasia diaphana TaxID=2652724 RepID=A0A913X5R4_EXADI|nr:bone morphogenetic protein 1-like [Exaiptasia diaphana]
MHHNRLNAIFISFSYVLVLEGVVASGLLTEHKQSACHNSNVLLDCKYYENMGSAADLSWGFRDVTTQGWKRIALIRNGNRRIFKNTRFDDRITLHTNGSLEIKTLKPEDATRYQCKVSKTGQRDTHIIELTVMCNGKVTFTKQEVCVEEDVLLDCQAKYRTNPLHLRRVMWHKKDASSWSLVLASDKQNVSRDGIKLHDNGSLLLPAGRPTNEMKYKCDVIKNVISPRERHVVIVKNVKCHREKRFVAATIKTTEGRAAMTTIAPIQATTVSMETSPSSVTSEKTVQPSTQFTSSPTKEDSGFCGKTVHTSVSGGFQSPSFPSPYPANSYCKWTISVPQDYAAIHITLNVMNLEHEANCQNDYIAITDELGNQVGCRQCGSPNKPITFHIKGKVAVVEFKSDSTVHKTGFQLIYKATKRVE